LKRKEEKKNQKKRWLDRIENDMRAVCWCVRRTCGKTIRLKV